VAAYFEAVAKACGQAKLASNWIMGEATRLANHFLDRPWPSHYLLSEIIKRVNMGEINRTGAVRLFEATWSLVGPQINYETGAPSIIDGLIKELDLEQIKDAGALEAIIDEVLAANPKNVEEFKAGNTKALNGLVGPIMKASKGKANPAQVNELLMKKLS
jgi:aspartyl-tRNA(Asn)/glutamyl-tRNA(Gln) amidotransferase subunit B